MFGISSLPKSDLKLRLMRLGAHVLRPALALAAVTACAAVGQAQVTQHGQLGVPGQEFRPSPSSIRNDIPRIVSNPAPSDVNPSFLGPVLLMHSARVNLEAGTATLPLRKGKMASGETVWYVLTDTSDRGISELLGVNYSPKLIYADLGRGVRKATIGPNGVISFSRGKVNFAPKLSLTPGNAPNYFPPKAVQPGSVGDEFYTPLFKTTNGNGNVIYNAPVVSFGTTEAALNRFCNGKADHALVHDKVTAICPRTGTVTLRLTLGYSFAKPIFYLSFDANNRVAATLEEATLTPVYDELGIRLEDAAIGSGLERILVIVNGPMGKGNPSRQGLNSAIGEGRGPINVLGGIPTFNLDYSPLWDMMMLQWSPEAVRKGYRTRIIDAFQALQFEAGKHITAPDGKPVGSSGIVINCPVVMRLN